ncbi:hypothetical protein SAMN05216480_10549 [Pustulibacterium marinum]|uniref:Uncharacterized protein n=1 Tax=Pustulibacterium marinum TaxID=1224947 RepID=A0A1I7GLF3_9FLAO|nr:hypothetical protein [Pustulibacterium marinum]SFU49161.1 hypothetical protein SAMN05216480_10549 [Pustulibacterium marinum]
MTKENIEEKFNEVLNKRGALTKAGVSKAKAYDWRKGRSSISFGEKLEVLFNLQIIEVNESTAAERKA